MTYFESQQHSPMLNPQFWAGQNQQAGNPAMFGAPWAQGAGLGQAAYGQQFGYGAYGPAVGAVNPAGGDSSANSPIRTSVRSCGNCFRSCHKYSRRHSSQMRGLDMRLTARRNAR